MGRSEIRTKCISNSKNATKTPDTDTIPEDFKVFENAEQILAFRRNYPSKNDLVGHAHYQQQITSKHKHNVSAFMRSYTNTQCHT